MKKLTSFIKPLGLICLLLFSISLIIASCKKHSGDNSDVFNLTELQNWETKNFNHNALLFNTLKPDWSKVFINHQENQNVYEVDVINQEKLFLSLGFTDPSSADSVAAKSKIKMLFFKDDESGKITGGYYMVSISDENPHYKKYENYTGAVYYYGSNGNLINGFIYDKGKATKSIKGTNAEAYKASLIERPVSLRGISGRKLQLAMAQTCYTDVSPVYGFSCITVETYTECTPYVKGYNYTTVCTDVPIASDGAVDGSGGTGGGGSGGNNNGGGTAPTGPEETEEQKEAKRQTDCETFTFRKTTEANWQEAGVNNIKLSWVWLGGSSGIYTSRDMQVSGLVLGFPTYYTNSNGSTTNLSAGKAANRAAIAVEMARRYTYAEFRDSPYYPQDAEVKKYFIAQVALIMAANKGTAGTTGSGSTNIVFNDEKRSYITDPLDCDDVE
ncbi:MAG: hypothetical protein J7577_06585 [Sphingobacteriaceae bacterium]|nr:hypothetical protein [Sphingobacteriaceae bacterium]